jgi:endonuclease/exonuclease/phosphatase family metal-dependent hydrolase
MRFLFWNLCKKPIAGLVARLCRDHDIDIVVLVENEIATSQLLSELNIERTRYRFHPAPSERVSIFSRLPSDCITPIRDDGKVTFRRVKDPLKLDFVLVAAHLGSKLHLSDLDQASHAGRLVRELEKIEDDIGHQRTVVVGDLNMNPFEPGIIGSDSFHAVMSRTIAASETRTVDGRTCTFFYNPMWSKYAGDPPGTYFMRKSVPHCYFWNMFDQVLIRPELVDGFSDDDLRIITTIGTTNLLRDSGRPDTTVASDHLPIVFSLRLESEV